MSAFSVFQLYCGVKNLGLRGHDRMLVGLTTVCVQSVPITTKVVGSNPTHGEVYSIQHYVIKIVSDFPTGQWFSQSTQVSSTNKTDSHDITEIGIFQYLLFWINFFSITKI
jgi:hypothetical protein